MTLRDRIDQLLRQKTTMRAVARDTGVDVAYLHRLYSGDKEHPSDETLRKLGLRAVVDYLPLGTTP